MLGRMCACPKIPPQVLVVVEFFSGVVAGFCFVWVFLAFFCLVVLGCGSLVVCFSFFNMLLKVTKIKQAPWDT